MVKPNFLIIGATKAGTTSLHRYLSIHPDIFLPQEKEPHYFAFANNPPKFVGPGSIAFNNEIITDKYNYYKLFDNDKARKSIAVGEASVMYIYYYKELIENIKNQLGEDVKLILILRNPIDRAFSSYLHLIRDGLENTDSFGEAILKEKVRIKDNWMPLFYYIELGYYSDAIQYIYDNYKKSNIKIFIYEDFCDNPVNVYEEICDFIGVNNNFKPDFSIKYNSSGVPKYDFLHKLYLLFRENRFGTQVIKKFIPDIVKQKLIGANLSKPNLATKDKHILYDKYKKSISELENLVGRDLSQWKL